MCRSYKHKWWLYDDFRYWEAMIPANNGFVVWTYWKIGVPFFSFAIINLEIDKLWYMSIIIYRYVHMDRDPLSPLILSCNEKELRNHIESTYLIFSIPPFQNRFFLRLWNFVRVTVLKSSLPHEFNRMKRNPPLYVDFHEYWRTLFSFSMCIGDYFCMFKMFISMNDTLSLGWGSKERRKH